MNSNLDFLNRKEDYSPFLVHLTKDNYYPEYNGDYCKMPAYEVLDCILDECQLNAYNHFFPYSPNLNSQKESIINKFKVVCFTETPLEQINVILDKTIQKQFNPEPYGLVFKKDYIREKGGNPVFYVSLKIAKPLWDYLYHPYIEGKDEVNENICNLLALITKCEKGTDFHWEREWRIVGNLKFKLSEVFCGLCPDNDMTYFENKYKPLKFISPDWDFNKILAKLIAN